MLEKAQDHVNSKTLAGGLHRACPVRQSLLPVLPGPTLMMSLLWKLFVCKQWQELCVACKDQRLVLLSGFLNFIQSCIWPVFCVLPTVTLPSVTVMWFDDILLCSLLAGIWTHPRFFWAPQWWWPSTQVEQFLFCVCSGRLVGLSVALTVMALWKQLMMRAPQVIQSWSYPTVDGCWPTVWQVRSLWSVWEVVHTSVWSCLHFFGSSRLNIFPHCYSPLLLWNACSHPGWPWSQGWT